MDASRRLLVRSLVVGCVACTNAGAERVLGLEATGVVYGVVYFDRNGSREPDLGDAPFAGLSVRLVMRGTADTVARATSDSTGRYRIEALPVGIYTVVVGGGPLGDSLEVVRLSAAEVTLAASDSVAVTVAVSFPLVTTPEARTLVPGKKVFLVGVALNHQPTFGDSTVHLADTAGALRMTGVRQPLLLAGDSLRVLGLTSRRDGQPTLADPSFATLAIRARQPQHDVSTDRAAAADDGPMDAALVRVREALIQDTATVAGSRRLTVDDGSGPLEVRLDTIAGFQAAALAADTIGARISATGVLVPTGTGIWVLKPRSPSDVTHH